MHDLAWSPDGAHVVATGASGNVVLARLCDRRCVWAGGLEASTTASADADAAACIAVSNARDGSTESLQLRQPPLLISLAHGHLVAVTLNYCYVYK